MSAPTHVVILVAVLLSIDLDAMKKISRSSLSGARPSESPAMPKVGSDLTLGDPSTQPANHGTAPAIRTVRSSGAQAQSGFGRFPGDHPPPPKTGFRRSGPLTPERVHLKRASSEIMVDDGTQTPDGTQPPAQEGDVEASLPLNREGYFGDDEGGEEDSDGTDGEGDLGPQEATPFLDRHNRQCEPPAATPMVVCMPKLMAAEPPASQGFAASAETGPTNRCSALFESPISWARTASPYGPEVQGTLNIESDHMEVPDTGEEGPMAPPNTPVQETQGQHATSSFDPPGPMTTPNSPAEGADSQLPDNLGEFLSFADIPESERTPILPPSTPQTFEAKPEPPAPKKRKVDPKTSSIKELEAMLE